MAYKKYPYQRRSKRRVKRDTILIPLKNEVLTIPKEGVMLKAMVMQAKLWEYAKNEEEALLIAELLTVSLKEFFL